MLIHIFENTPHHYIGMQEFYIEQCQINQKQAFWVKAPNLSEVLCKEASKQYFVTYTDRDELLAKLNNLKKTDTVIFHGLTDAKLWLKLVFHHVVKRSSCVIWGYELYRHTHQQRSIKQIIIQCIHCLLMQRMQKVITLNPGDGDLVQKYLKRKNVEIIPYPLIGFALTQPIIAKPIQLKETEKNNGLANALSERPLKLLIGNSAAKSNEHIDAFKQIMHLAEHNIEVIVPLNYAGKEGYIKQVIKSGNTLFGKKFTPITTMLSKQAYNELLQDIDVAIFAHNRQQGLYVAYAMLLMGKPLFLRENTTSFDNLRSLGFSVSSLSQLSGYDFEVFKKLCDLEGDENRTLMEKHFTEKALAPKWSHLLNGFEN